MTPSIFINVKIVLPIKYDIVFHKSKFTYVITLHFTYASFTSVNPIFIFLVIRKRQTIPKLKPKRILTHFHHHYKSFNQRIFSLALI